VKAIKIVEAKGKEVIGTEVTFDTPSGRRRADVVTRDRKTGQIEAHEVKTGQSRYIPKQRRMDGDLNTPGVGGVPAGDRAKAAGLTPGTPVVIPTTVIRLP
jgi:hypothetical protein